MTNSILRAVIRNSQLEYSSSMGLLIGEKLISMGIQYGKKVTPLNFSSKLRVSPLTLLTRG